MWAADQSEKMRVLQGQARLQRQAFSRSLVDVSERMRPQNLVDQGKQFVARRAGPILANVADSVKAHGGPVALAAAGAILAFDLGRGSVSRDARATHDDGTGEHAIKGAGRASPRPSISTKTTAVLTWGAGVLMGHLLVKGVSSTDVERRLFEATSAKIRRAAVEFADQHSHGAKIAVAQAFGFARYAAAFLAVMAGVGEISNVRLSSKLM